MPNPEIDFNAIEGPVYTGRSRGEQLRTVLQLEDFDNRPESVNVRIPNETYSISSSFFLGLFGPSVTKLGSSEAFYAKYHFVVSDFFKKIIDGHVARALQERSLFDHAKS